MRTRTKVIAVATMASAATVLALSVAQAIGGGSPASDQAPLDPRITPAVGETKTLHVPTRVEGRLWWVKTYRNRHGNFCFDENVPGEGVGSACLAASESLFTSKRKIYVTVGARQHENSLDLTRWDDVWIDGFAAPSIARLEIVNADCTRTPVNLDSDGVFLTVYTANDLYSGAWPVEMIGFGPAGNVVATAAVNLFVPDTAQSRSAGTKPPSRRACG